VLPGVVNWAATIGWVAFNNVFGATALKLLIHAPYWLGLLLIFAGGRDLGARARGHPHV
jgi:hypothetical protein